MAIKYLDPRNGNDGNSGNDWANAYASFGHTMTQISFGDTVNIADGVIYEAVTLPLFSFSTPNIINCSPNTLFQGDGANVWRANNLFVMNGGQIVDYARVEFNEPSGFAPDFAVFNGTKINGVDVENVHPFNVTRALYTNCKLIDGQHATGGFGAQTAYHFFVDKSVLSNTTMNGQGQRFKNNYGDAASFISMKDNVPVPDLSYNAFAGGILYETVVYTLGDTLPDGLVPNILTVPQINAPGFINFADGLYFLSPSSPLIKKNSDGGNIGGAVLGQRVLFQDSQMQGGILTDIQAATNGDAQVLPPALEGKITTLPIQYAQDLVQKTLGAISPLSSITWVKGGAPSLNANIITLDEANEFFNLELQFTTSSTQPSTDAEWTNNALTAPNTWIKIRWGVLPEFDGIVGNGDPSYTSGSALPVVFYRLRITLKDSI